MTRQSPLAEFLRYLSVLSWLPVAFAARADDRAPLQLIQTIDLPNVAGRIDHLAVDVTGQRLFVAALGNNTVEVIDLRAGARIHSVSGLHEPQGVAYVPDLNRLFVANGEGGAVDVLDGGSFRPIAKVKFSDDADNLRYDGATKQVYVGYGSGGLGLIDATSATQIGDIPLAGHPESFQLEKSGMRIFVNVPNANHIAVVDRQQRAVVATWPSPGARANFPMALDEEHHRLFVGFRKPPRLAVLDTESGRLIASMDTAGDTDDVFYDAARARICMSCGEGFIDVFHQQDADHHELIAKLSTTAGARTSLFVPELNRLYLAVPRRTLRGAEIRVYKALP